MLKMMMLTLSNLFYIVTKFFQRKEISFQVKFKTFNDHFSINMSHFDIFSGEQSYTLHINFITLCFNDLFQRNLTVIANEEKNLFLVCV